MNLQYLSDDDLWCDIKVWVIKIGRHSQQDREDFTKDQNYFFELEKEIKRRLAERNQWQPISTAPQDGEHILGIDKYGSCYVGTYGCGYHKSFCTEPGGTEYPTHWMPLPKRPEDKS